MNQLYNEDCLIGMKKLPDGVVDAMICDPPYGTTDNAWDVCVPFAEMWRQILRVCKPNAAMVFFAQMPFGSDLIQSQRKLYRYELIWEKSCAVGFLNAKKMPLRAHENILVFYRKLPTYNPQMRTAKLVEREGGSRWQSRCYGHLKYLTPYSSDQRYPRDVLRVNSVSNEGIGVRRLHPTQKPLKLLEWLIRTYSDEGELVLDPFAGSGTTAVAAVRTGRRYVCFESDREFYEVARERVESETRERVESEIRAEAVEELALEFC